MAIYHLSAKVISRGKGQSAIAASAYRSGEQLRDEQANEQKFYKARADRIQFTEVMAPKEAPSWAQDRNALWNHAERAEKRKDAQLAREIEVSLPHELTEQQREWLVKDFAREAFVRKGYTVDIAIHAPDKRSDERNHHAHILVTMRTLGPEGFAAKKDRSLNTSEQLGAWREQWGNLANRHLERHGHAARIDHRSLEAQGVEREATIHLGYAAKEIDARGGQSERMEAFKGVQARNGLRAEMKAIDREMAGLEGRAAPQPSTARARAIPAPENAMDVKMRAMEVKARAVTPAKDRAPIRVIGGIARPAAGMVKGSAKLAGGIANAFEKLLGGAGPAPGRDDEKAPLDAGGTRPRPDIDEAVQREQEQKSATRQKYLRDFSREVPEEKQRDAEIERTHDPTTGRERRRGE